MSLVRSTFHFRDREMAHDNSDRFTNESIGFSVYLRALTVCHLR